MIARVAGSGAERWERTDREGLFPKHDGKSLQDFKLRWKLRYKRVKQHAKSQKALETDMEFRSGWF